MTIGIPHPVRKCVLLALAMCSAVVAAEPALSNVSVFTKLAGKVDDVGRGGARAARGIDDVAANALRASTNKPGMSNASVLVADGNDVKLVVKTESTTVITPVKSASEVSHTLTQTGISAILVPEEMLSKVRHLLPSLPEAYSIRLVRKDSTIVPVKQLPSGRLLAQLGDDKLFMEFHSLHDLDTFQDVARLRLARTQLEVVSLFDPREIDVVRLLDRTAGDSHRAVKPTEVPTLATELAAGSSDKLTVLVGHIEETALVMRGTQGEMLARVSIAEFEHAMAQAGKNVLVLGCESACAASSGYLSPVNVTDVAQALSVVRFGGTYGELLSGLAKASPDGLVVTASFLNDARFFVEARATMAQTARSNQIAFNRVRVAAAVPNAWMKPVAATFQGAWEVLQILGIIWLVGLINSVFLVKNTWRAWQDRSTREGNSYAGPIRRRLVRIISVGAFLLWFPYMVAAELAYLLVMILVATLTIVLGVSQWPSATPWIVLAAVIGYALALFAWGRLLHSRPWVEAAYGLEPFMPLFSGWRDYVSLYFWAVGLPLLIATIIIELAAHKSPSAEWMVALEAIPLSIVSFVLLLRACRQSGIGPYDLPIAAVTCLYQWLRWSRRPQGWKPVWLRFAEGWRGQ
jgi:hypothetical protein